MADKEVYHARLAYVINETPETIVDPRINSMNDDNWKPEIKPSSTLQRLRETSLKRDSRIPKSELKSGGIPLVPELQIRQLTKIQPSVHPMLRKSPSLPSSPTPFRLNTDVKHSMPAYLTLRGAWDIKPISKDQISPLPCRSNSQPEVEEIEKIRSILASLDLAKYKRCRKPLDSSKEVVLYEPPSTSLCRSISLQPQRNCEKSPTKKSFLDSIPPSPSSTSSNMELVPVREQFYKKPKVMSSKPFCLDLVPKNSFKPVNPKLKELTERLANSAPPSPHNKMKQTNPHTAPATSTVSFWVEPFPSSNKEVFFDGEYDSNYFQYDGNTKIVNNESLESKSPEPQRSLLPLRTFKSATFSTFPRQTKLSNLSSSRDNQSPTISSLNLDTIHRSKYVPRCSNIKAGAISDTTDKSASGANCESTLKNKLLALPAPPIFSSSFDSSKQNNTENCTPVSPLCVKQHRVINNHGDRPFTSPQHTRKIYTTESCAFTDNSDLKLLKEIPLESKANRQNNELSLADSQLWQSDVSAEETFVDVVGQPNYSKAAVEYQNDKTCKKKYNSDPGTDNQNNKLSNLLLTFKSESSLSPPTAKKITEVDRTETNKGTDGLPKHGAHMISKSNTNKESPLEKGIENISCKSSENTEISKPDNILSGTVELMSNNNATGTSNGMVSHQKRYSKKRLRGPYGEMLEQEMSKSTNKPRASYSTDLDFLKDLESKPPPGSGRSRPFLRSTSHSFDETQTYVDLQESGKSSPKRKTSANLPIVSRDSDLKSLPVPSSAVSGTVSEPSLHVRSYSAGSSGIYKPDPHWNYGDEICRILAQSQRKVGRNARSPVSMPCTPRPRSSSGPARGSCLGPTPTTHRPSLQHQPSVSLSSTSSTHSMFGGRFKQRARSDPWISDRIRRYFSRRFTVGTDSPSQQHTDTRTHIVGELYETEKSYVESLQILVKKYMKAMKGPELSGSIDSSQVDEIFFQIPEILSHHEAFLEVLKQRLTTWDTKQKIGDIFVDVFTHQSVIDTYTAFINNWKSAKEAIKAASHAKPAVAKFLEHTSREHKGKLSIDALLIMPVQRIPRYELLIKELLKHTPIDHPDHRLLLQAQKEVHDLAVNINRVEREAFEQEQNLQKLKDIEHLIEGIVDLAQLDRTFLRYDYVTIPGGLGIKKDRCLFLFSDLLLITSIKKKSTAMRKTSLVASGASSFGSLESNKYKLLMRLSLRNIEITKRVDERYIKKFLKEVGYLEGDVAVLGKVADMLGTLSCQHQVLDDAVKDVLSMVSKQLIDKQTTNSQLMMLELVVTMENEMESLTVIFPNPEKRMTWENNFNEAKENIALTSRRSLPIFLYSLPIRKTRAGLQVTCAVPIRQSDQNETPDIWICSSDGLVGQICILSLQREPEVTSFYTVCNAKILCIIHVPSACQSQQLRRRSLMVTNLPHLQVEEETETQMKNVLRSNSFQLDSESSDEDDFIDSMGNGEQELSSESHDGIDYSKPTVWLGTEDGCIFVYSSDDRKKTKIRVQLPAAVYDIVHFENKIFVALASGELFIYHRDQSGSWNTSNPQKILIASPSASVSKMTLSSGRIWCGNANTVSVLNTSTLSVEHTFQVTPDLKQPITIMVACGQGVWVTTQNSSVIKLFHSTTFQEILEINTAPSVTKMLNACDDIIRQHKAACLRISALHTCKNVLWIGTSAGVVLTLPLPHITTLTSSIDTAPTITGISQGHTGHVRFITSVETTRIDSAGSSHAFDQSVRPRPVVSYSRPSCSGEDTTLVFSIGDGYEDFGCVAIRETAGRDDSTNHLLLWRM